MPLTKPRHWVLLNSFEYKGKVVPKGFIFDGASIPTWLRWIFPHGGAKFAAACFHDWGYRLGKITRKEADDAFLDIMLANGVSAWRARTMYAAVRVFGKLHYKG